MIIESENTLSVISKIITNNTYSVEEQEKIVGSFSGTLKENEVNYIKVDIYDKFGVNINKSNSSFECYIPGDVLYKMNKDTALRKKIYDMLADYTSTKFQRARKALNPPVKKCTLVFDKNGDVVATLEPDLDAGGGDIKSSSSKADILHLLGECELGTIVLETPQNVYQGLEVQALMLSTGLIKKRKK